jgi:hypothetical protein
MIAMISQEHTFLESIFVKSNIKEMMLLTNVPLIILPQNIPDTNQAFDDTAKEE